MNQHVGKKKILVVEDEPAISHVCQRTLTSEGFEVDIAVNGEVAQNMIENNQYDYDLCLIDVRTPTMSGEEFYQWLQGKHPGLAAGVILTTGDLMGGDTADFIEQEKKPFLPKPFTPDELKTMVKRVLRRKAR